MLPTVRRIARPKRLNCRARQLMVSAPAQTIRPGKNSQLHIKLLIQEEIVLNINIKINEDSQKRLYLTADLW